MGIAGIAVGGLGLPLGGVVMTWWLAGREGLRDLGRRLVDPRRIRGRWWAVVLLLPPALVLAAGGLALLGGTTDAPFDPAGAAEGVRGPASLLAYLGFLLVSGPLPEEIGWRGYFLDRLRLRFGPLGASLVLGLAWFVWMAPLYLVPGYYGLTGGPPHPLQLAVLVVLLSTLYTWIHEPTGRSVLAAVLFHLSWLATDRLLDPVAPVQLYATALTGLVVVLVLRHWTGRT